MASNKPVIGLTGGIATGKSSVRKIFESLGWSALSADRIVDDLLSCDQKVRGEVFNRWGNSVFLESGNIDKSCLGEIVFKSEQERRWLEELIHPLVRKHWISFCKSCPNNPRIIELPLLFENDLKKHFNFIITTYAPKKICLSRLSKRGFSPEQSQQRINAQWPTLQKAELADFVILGSGSLSFLTEQTKLLSQQLIYHSPIL